MNLYIHGQWEAVQNSQDGRHLGYQNSSVLNPEKSFRLFIAPVSEMPMGPAFWPTREGSSTEISLAWAVVALPKKREFLAQFNQNHRSLGEWSGQRRGPLPPDPGDCADGRSGVLSGFSG